MADESQHPLGLDSTAFNVLTTSAVDLSKMLANGTMTTSKLLPLYLDQIDQHNHKGLRLNAVISVAPLDSLKAQAAKLDAERSSGNARGPFHGIPILVKDNIMTEASLGMDTTCGSFALKGVKVKRNADIVTAILEAGMLIIGKTNLSEWAGKKGYLLPGGWSAVGGQTQTPYVVGGYVKGDKFLGHSNPCGSSSGSAVGVAAGFGPLALGTETDGSITQPAGRASLYAIKATVGGLSTEGTSPYSAFSDSVGPITKTPEDLAILLGILMKQDFTSDLVKSWKGQKIAFLDRKDWPSSPVATNFVPELVEKQESDIIAASNLIEQLGAKVVRDVKLIPYSALEINGRDALEEVWDHDFQQNIARFLEGYVDPPIKSVNDLVEYNRKHHEKELPEEFPNGQGQLEDVLGNHISDEDYENAKIFIRTAAKDNGFDAIFAKYDVDLVVSLLDCRVGSMSAAAGYPHATVPLGYADNFNGRAYGLTIVAGAGQENKIIQFMSAWEASHPNLRKPPPQLVSWGSGNASI